MPKVSVVIATYRRTHSLKRALESLVNQSYKNIEVILIDDNGNTEWNSKIKLIVDNFRKRHPYIPLKYIVNHKNIGSAKTRNVGINASSGEFVTFLDDDDIYLPDKIKKQVISMQNSKADYSITDLALYSNSEKLIEVRKRDYIKKTTPNALLRYHLMYHITGTDTMMFRKTYLMKIGGFSHIDVGDEFYLMQKAIEGKGRFLYVPVCDVKAYVHKGEEGLSSGQGKIDGENTLYEYKKKYFNRLSERNIKYIKVRHYAVLAYAFLRMRRLWLCLGSSIRGFLTSPILFFKILINR